MNIHQTFLLALVLTGVLAAIVFASIRLSEWVQDRWSLPDWAGLAVAFVPPIAALYGFVVLTSA